MLAQEADKRPPRVQYLETIGLKRPEVFDTPVAELELHRSTDRVTAAYTSAEQRPPYFYEFFVAPPLHSEPALENVRLALRQPGTSLVFGRPGDGKTTLRLALEADCRRDPARTLAVSYALEEDFEQPLDLAEHRDRLAQALAVDLVVHIIERFNPLNPLPSVEQIALLGQQIQTGGASLRRLIQHVLEEPEPDSIYGVSAHWSIVRRPIVQRVAASPELLQLLRAAQLAASNEPPADALTAGLTALRHWGFERCLVLVDGVDTHTRRRDAHFMLRLLEPLLVQLAVWETQNLWFKFFLPLELAPSLEPRRRALAAHLTYPFVTAIMGEWQLGDFQRLLANRFRAGGSRRVSWDDLTDDNFNGSLDQALARAAHGSPRRFLQLISALIDAHAVRAPLDRFINLTDWTRMRQQWINEPPPPPDFERI